MAFEDFGQTGVGSGQTLDAAFTSPWFNVGNKTMLGIHVIISNTDAVGTIQIEATNDSSAASAAELVVGFKDETDTTQTSVTVASGTDVDQGLAIRTAEFVYYRVVYTYTSGGSSNTLAVTMSPKKG